MAKQQKITLIRRLIAQLWPTNEKVLEKLGPCNDTNFHKVLRDDVRADRINQHFNGANTVSNDSMNEYMAGIESLSAYSDPDLVQAYYSRFANPLEGRKNLKIRLFGSSGEHKSGRCGEGTEREQALEWFLPRDDEEKQK